MRSHSSLMGFFFTAVFIANSAHATLSRVATFGTQPVFTSTLGALPSSVSTSVANGSLWYDDDSNIFYNPSYALDQRNTVFFQKGLEGGAIFGLDELNVLGVYFNRGGALGSGYFNDPGVYTSGPQRQYAPGMIGPGIREIGGQSGINTYTGSTEGSSIGTKAPVDLIFASDYGVKWGVHVATAQNPGFGSGDEKDARYWHADAGIQFLGFEPFFGTTFSSDIETKKAGASANQGDQELNEWNAGTRFKYETWNAYFIYKYFNVSGTPLTASREVSTEMRILGAGVGRDLQIMTGLRFLGHLGIFLNFVEDADTTLPANAFPNIYKSYAEYSVPLNLALEYEATLDLQLRAGVSVAALRGTNIDETQPGAVTAEANLRRVPEARIGAAYYMNDFLRGASVDGVLGNGYATRNGRTTSENSGFENQFFAMVSATYRWDPVILQR